MESDEQLHLKAKAIGDEQRTENIEKRLAAVSRRLKIKSGIIPADVTPEELAQIKGGGSINEPTSALEEQRGAQDSLVLARKKGEKQ